MSTLIASAILAAAASVSSDEYLELDLRDDEEEEEEFEDSEEEEEEEPVKESKPAKAKKGGKKAKKVEKSSKSSKKSSKSSKSDKADKNVVRLKDLAKQAKLTEAVARKKLRDAEIPRGEGRWAWEVGSKALKQARKALDLPA